MSENERISKSNLDTARIVLFGGLTPETVLKAYNFSNQENPYTLKFYATGKEGRGKYTLNFDNAVQWEQWYRIINEIAADHAAFAAENGG